MGDLKVFEDIRKKNLGSYLKDCEHLYRNTEPISDNGNFAFQFPVRNNKYPVMPQNDYVGDHELAWSTLR